MTVPGFITRPGDRGPYRTLAGPAGLLIPVRDPQGRIVALKIRRDEAGAGNRYCYLSSKRYGGPGPGAPVHCPLGVTAAETVRLTEGELKADIATVLSGVPTIAAPGVTQWRPAVAVLQQLGAKTVQLAYDTDAARQPQVAAALLACGRGLTAAGCVVTVERWAADYKGIDDLLAAGQQPTLAAWADVVPAGADPVGPPPAGDSGEVRKSQATRLVEWASAGLELFASPAGEAFATRRQAPRQTWLLRSKLARHYLARLYWQMAATAPGSEALQAAITILEGKALFESPVRPVFCRLAEVEGAIYLDLGDAAWRAVALRPGSWEVVAEPPVRFRRARGLLALPEPVRGGSIEELRRWVNVASEEDWRLLVGWLLAALRPTGPYPVLCLFGEQGSAKSTTARLLRALVDPSTSPLRAEPRDVRDLLIGATNSWVIALDNLAHLPTWLSDALCRLATGGGFATRELFTNDEETLLEAQRPCLLTGIEDVASRNDLLERALVVRLPAIRDEQRQTEQDLWRSFEAARPRLLGALLDGVAAGLANLPHTRLTRLPRMADFATWVTACEPALAWGPQAFVAAYTGNLAEANEVALDGAPIVGPLRQLLEEEGAWEGSVSGLLERLNQLAGEKAVRDRDWPKRPNTLSGKLRRFSPNLRKIGIDVEQTRNKRGSWVRVALAETSRHGSSPSAPSSPAAPPPAPVGDGRQARADPDDDPGRDHRSPWAAGGGGDDGGDLFRAISGRHESRNGPYSALPPGGDRRR